MNYLLGSPVIRQAVRLNGLIAFRSAKDAWPVVGLEKSSARQSTGSGRAVCGYGVGRATSYLRNGGGPPQSTTLAVADLRATRPRSIS